jgi:hypothetical protein
MKRYALPLVLLCACTTPQTGSPRGHPQPEFVGKVWVSTDASAAPGTFRIFLPDGTLVMDSCWETYRLAPWRTIDGRRIEWTEDTARIVAQITQLTGERLHLRLQLGGGKSRRRPIARRKCLPSVPTCRGEPGCVHLWCEASRGACTGTQTGRRRSSAESIAGVIDPPRVVDPRDGW